MKYEMISSTQPGIQWMDHGGYCGSWSIQRAMLAKGAWISQQQVRNHAQPAGGNDEEILAGNIDGALKNLKIKAEGFDWKNLPTPQKDAYLKWIKKQLVSGHALAWLIMLDGERYPIYNLTLPDGVYGHVEPVVGILSNHPLTDETVYDDDVVVHYTDADTHTYYRTMASLPGEWSEGGVGRCQANHYTGYPCIWKQHGFAWAMQGFLDAREGKPLSLAVDPWASEPDTRTGAAPIQISGTLTASALKKGAKYAIYRWGTVDEAFTYSDAYKVTQFTAANDTFVFQDPKPFSSDSATYYRCVSIGEANIVV